jgi:sensor histidine kinase YesM
MHPNIGLSPARGDAPFVTRVARTFHWQRVTAGVPAVALVTLLLSLGPLVSPAALLDFFSPAEIALAWLEHLIELAVIAVVLMAAYTVLDEALPRSMQLRLAKVCALLLALSALLSVLLHAYYADGFEHLPPPLRMLADSLRWGLPAVFLALIADAHRRALQTDSAAHAAEVARAQSQQGESEQQLALLQAQIEPHFLFNMLGNVRRLYRTQPQAGAEAIGSLMRYLHTALPQMRSRRASLGEEIALVRAYLDLFQLRMGAQLSVSIDVDAALNDADFPPMLLITLVENAIKHGLEPAGGGHIEVRAQRRDNLLEVTVLDDGVGFGATASSGTGVGLVNVRRQLAARYQRRARLTLEAGEPRGARATIVIPLASAQAVDPVSRDGSPALTTTKLAAAAPMPLDEQPAKQTGGFARWFKTHRGAVAMAGLLAFAGPLTFSTGALSIMRAPMPIDLARLGLGWMLYAVSLWGLLLVTGYGCERLTRRVGRYAGGGLWLLAACLTAALPTILAAARATVLMEQGIVHSTRAMHLHGFTISLIMALLYFAHLRRSREHEQAAARLAAAQAAQRDVRRHIVQARLQEVQARIDPQVLFEMLETVRRLYEHNAALAERFLDELIVFLRAALPRLRAASSSLLREVELACAFVRLHALAGDSELDMTIDVAPDAMHARFPPGVLLPLLDTVVASGAGPCRLAATRSSECCRLVLSLGSGPSERSVARVQSLLMELYGTATQLEIESTAGAVDVIVKVPYELA